MSPELSARRGSRVVGLLALAVLATVSILALFGYRATREWQRSVAQSVERRADESANLVVTALTRDMRGAQSWVLASRDSSPFAFEDLTDATSHVAAAFARYPYPESFFVWRHGADAEMVFFNRANRDPVWVPHARQTNRYPVVSMVNPSVAAPLLTRIARDAAAGRRYSVFETTLNGTPYQIVARLEYQDPFREHLTSIFGFTVNLAWVQQAYFSEIPSQVARIANSGVDIDLAVLDDSGRSVNGRTGGPPHTVREFSLLFFDPSIVALDPPADLVVRTWSVRVSAANDPTLIWATRGADWTMMILVAASLALGASLLVAVRALRASAQLTEMRSEFVSTVTHELKTPLATIRAVGDTLVRGRLTGAGAVRDYAQILVQESKHLTRLLDNLLAYARVTDVADVYSMEAHAPAELIEDALRGFKQQLEDGSFDLTIDIPPDLPMVCADRTAMRLALDNLIDNAIRYSADRRSIRIAARESGSFVQIEVQDQGTGIAPNDLPLVHRKFVRGRFARPGGSGLGLAIVNRIVADHQGTLHLESDLGVGTVARLQLPRARGAHAKTNSRR
jgi:signal transduction histidine kinase